MCFEATNKLLKSKTAVRWKRKRELTSTQHLLCSGTTQDRPHAFTSLSPMTSYQGRWTLFHKETRAQSNKVIEVEHAQLARGSARVGG